MLSLNFLCFDYSYYLRDRAGNRICPNCRMPLIQVKITIEKYNANIPVCRNALMLKKRQTTESVDWGNPSDYHPNILYGTGDS